MGLGPKNLASGCHQQPCHRGAQCETSWWRAHLAAYRESLKNLAACGVHTVCYNFMPVLDWTRTDLSARQPDGGTAMAFDLIDFAAFDLCILQRAGAQDDYSAGFVEKAQARAAGMSDAQKTALANNIVAGLPGANDNWTLEAVRDHLATYAQITPERLRQNPHALLDEEARRRAAGRADHEIPMRPDHGHAIVSDLDRPVMPGYPLIGRLRGLAELRGIMAGYVGARP